MIQKLPLFPLNTVLFPGAPLTLHIFEERYREMIRRCLEQSSPFGVVLIRSGREVSPDDPFMRRLREMSGIERGEPEENVTIPYAVGTTARISESLRLEDGRYWLTAVGQRRFRIQYISQHQPTMIASVAYLSEETTPILTESADRVRTLYARYWSAIESASGQRYEAEALPEDVVELSYTLAHRLRIDNARKQRWLEADVATRLREIGNALLAELSLLPDRAPGGSPGTPWTWN